LSDSILFTDGAKFLLGRMAAIQHDWSSFKIFRFKISLGLKTFKFKVFNIVLRFFEIQNSRLEDCHALRGRTSAILHEFQGFQRLKDFKDARIPLEKGQLDSWP